MTAMLGGVRLDYLGADEWRIRCGETEARVTTRDSGTAAALGRTLAALQGMYGGVEGPPCDCPICGSVKTRVVDTRPLGDTVRRRRRCRACGVKWTTEERTLAIGKVT